MKRGIDAVMEADGSDPLIIQADKRLLPRYSAISSAMPAITPRPGKRSAFRSPKLMTLWDFPLKIQGVHIPEEEIPGLFEPFTRGAVT